MKYLLIILALILLIVLIIAVVGYMLPVKHTATATLMVNAPPQSVWARVRDFKKYPGWRKSLKSVEAQSDTSWIEIDAHDHPLPLKIISEEPGRKLVTQINGKGLPFGGTWAFILKPQGSQTELTITENGEVYNPIFRFVSKFFMGHDATIKQYARDIEACFP